MTTVVSTSVESQFDSVILTVDTAALGYREECPPAGVYWAPPLNETTLEKRERESGPDSATNPDEAKNWVEIVTARARKLSMLPRGWDGYGGPAPSLRIVHVAQELFERLRDSIPTDLPDPFVCPVSGGGLQIEITSDKKHLELMFASDSEIVFLKEEAATGKPEMDAGELDAGDAHGVRKLLTWFASH